ncbi:hypothetical protein MN608_09311 [Microdochium nivale]|nr:hypothetical protein MN608_09311 [Microdochium nivale]
MKFSAITFAAAALVATVAGQDTSVIYKVTNFKAACVPHSVQCTYSFGVFEPGTMQTVPQICSAMVTQGVPHELPAVEKGECALTSKTWTITKADDGLTLSVFAEVSPGSFKSGVHKIGANELEMVVSPTDPNGIHQVYKGPEDFNLVRPASE